MTLFPGSVRLDLVARIMVLRGCGESQASIGKRLNVSQATVSRYTKHARDALKKKSPEQLMRWAVQACAAIKGAES